LIKFGCPRFGAFLFLRLTWDSIMTQPENHHAVSDYP
jgi:hypothetical protein